MLIRPTDVHVIGPRFLAKSAMEPEWEQKRSQTCSQSSLLCCHLNLWDEYPRPLVLRKCCHSADYYVSCVHCVWMCVSVISLQESKYIAAVPGRPAEFYFCFLPLGVIMFCFWNLCDRSEDLCTLAGMEYSVVICSHHFADNQLLRIHFFLLFSPVKSEISTKSNFCRDSGKVNKGVEVIPGLN